MRFSLKLVVLLFSLLLHCSVENDTCTEGKKSSFFKLRHPFLALEEEWKLSVWTSRRESGVGSINYDFHEIWSVFLGKPSVRELVTH